MCHHVNMQLESITTIHSHLSIAFLVFSTEVFTSYTAGVYTINYNTLSWINYGGGEVKMMVFHNGIEVPETEIYSYASEHAHDMASRSLVGKFQEKS